MKKLAHELARARGFHIAGHHARAEQLLNRLIIRHPDHPELLGTYGCFLKDVGRPAEAAKWLERLVELSPASATHWLDLGCAYQDSACFEAALLAYRQAIALDPTRWQVYLNLAYVLESQQEYAEAETFYRYALKLKPDCAPAWSGLGEICLRRKRPEDAIPCFTEALTLSATADVYCNLAQAQVLCRQYDAAIATARKAIALAPGLALAHAHEGRALMHLSRFLDSKDAFETALAAAPDCNSALVGMADIHSVLCNWQEAVSFFSRALETADELNQPQIHSSLLFTLTNMPAVEPDRLLAEHERWAAFYATARRTPRSPQEKDPDRRLRIGFVSGDLRSHSVRSFIAPLLRGLDRGEFDITCYSTFAGADSTTAELRALAGGWCDAARLNDGELAGRIAADRIDILVDLSGHTVGNRLRVFARKPAPVAVTYLGYANTTGLTAIDYWMTDAVLHPCDTRHRTSEQIYRLPRCWVAFDPPADAPAVRNRPAGAPCTFVSFNHLWKLSTESLRLWSRVLAAIPESKLLLKARGLSGTRERSLVMERLAQAGAPAGRITFVGETPSQREHLALYEHADVALDTTPYSGGTTTAEALWMGVPVITLPGPLMASRMSASMLDALGLNELIAQNEDDFIRIAAAIAADAALRAQLRAELRPRMAASPLTDGAGLAREIGAAFREMWAAYCAQTTEEAAR